MLFGKRERSIRSILVVEDEPLIAFDNEHFLVEAGYEVVATVDSLEDASRFIESATIHLVMTDISLRGDGNGIDVARAAQARGVPVLFVSGACPPEAEGFAIGCLAKPYTDRMLTAALEALDDHLGGRTIKRVPAGLSLFQQSKG
jgi:DNA-binding response OmpR family regulator